MSRLKDFHTPVFWAEGHPGKLNREGWVIEVSGLCANPKNIYLAGTDRVTEIDCRRASHKRYQVLRAREVGRCEGCRFTQYGPG